MDKKTAINDLRSQYAQTAFRTHMLEQYDTPDAAACIADLSEDGVFTSQRSQEATLANQDAFRSNEREGQLDVAEFLQSAWLKIWRIAESERGATEVDPKLRARWFRAALHYGRLERLRPDGRFRFHNSCFAIPTAAINAYFVAFETMQKIEVGETSSTLDREAHGMLVEIGTQAWTVPARHDETDDDPVQLERFRNHVWWVGGNGLTYRPVFPAAIMLGRADMIDVLAEVAYRGISAVSYRTQNTAFWVEGMTVDGAGWGHGRQTLIFGYPFHGMMAVLEMLGEHLARTPWHQPMTRVQADHLLKLLRGSTWFWYRGIVPPMFDRDNMVFAESTVADIHPGGKLAERVLSVFADILTRDETDELHWYARCALPDRDFTEDPPKPEHYCGVRYFWNQDTLIVKRPEWYFVANMSSARTDGMESAHTMAAALNLFTCDGQAVFTRGSNDLNLALGASDLPTLPGVTARQATKPWVPFTNWSGYHSRSELAGGLADGDFGCAGFELDKVNGHTESPDFTGEMNAQCLGVAATKSYYVFGNAVVCLGTGIRDRCPEFGGSVRTGVQQTLWKGDASVGLLGDDHPSTVVELGASEPYRERWDLANDELPTVRHDGFTYVVLPEQTTGHCIAEFEKRLSRWNELAPVNSDVKTPDMERIFHFYIDHGHDPDNARYGYAVCFDPDERVTSSQSLPRVLLNQPGVQAVASPDGTAIQAMFFDATQRIDVAGWSVAVSRPCALFIGPDGDFWQVIASDLTQSETGGPLRVEITYRSAQTQVQLAGQTTLFFPESPHAGQQICSRIALTEQIKHEHRVDHRINSTSKNNKRNTYESLIEQSGEELMYDTCTGDWEELWSLDSERARIINHAQGMDFHAGPTRGDDRSHAVLWTRQSFAGNLRIDYEFTRLDNAAEAVNILYFHATGSGEPGYARDIKRWADRRRTPAMRTYFNHMNLYHISYAAFDVGGVDPDNDYIRARRYQSGNSTGLHGTDLSPDYTRTGMFRTNIKHRISVVKYEDDLWMEIQNAGRSMLCHWKTDQAASLFDGRIGLRLMWTRCSR